MLDLGLGVGALTAGSALLAWGLAFAVRRLAARVGAIDMPRRGKLHTRPTPLMGGLAIFPAVFLPLLVLYALDESLRASFAHDPGGFFAILVAAAYAMLIGAVDDRRPLSARTKMLLQVPLGLYIAAFVLHIDAVRIPGFPAIELGVFGIPFTAVWIVGVINAVNLIDGLDGLASGVSLIAALCGATFAMITGHVWLAAVLFALTGACAGFLVHNFSPARIFLGDTGSLMLGATLAVSLLLATQDIHPWYIDPIVLSSVILGYPIVDTLLAMLRRGLNGKPVMSSDTGHIHHMLLARGFSQRQAAVSVYVVAALFAALALALWRNHFLLVGLSLMAVSSALTVMLYLIGFFQTFQPARIRLRRPHYQLVFHLCGAAIAQSRLATNRREILAAFVAGCQSLSMPRGRLYGRERQLDDGAAAEPELVVQWGDGQSDNSAAACVPIAMEFDPWRLEGCLETTGMPAEIVQEYHTRLRQFVEVALARLEPETFGATSDVLWPTIPSPEPFDTPDDRH